jgi:hypothetical protein
MLLVNGLIDGFAQGENRIRELTTPIVELGKNIYDQPVPTETRDIRSSRLKVELD